MDNFEQVYTKMEILGKISGKENRAAEIIDYTKKELQNIKNKIKAIDESEKPSSLFVWGPSKLDIAGSNSTGDSIIKMSGAKNSAADINEEHIVAKMEQVVNWNPVPPMKHLKKTLLRIMLMIPVQKIPCLQNY